MIDLGRSDYCEQCHSWTGGPGGRRLRDGLRHKGRGPHNVSSGKGTVKLKLASPGNQRPPIAVGLKSCLPGLTPGHSWAAPGLMVIISPRALGDASREKGKPQSGVSHSHTMQTRELDPGEVASFQTH